MGRIGTDICQYCNPIYKSNNDFCLQVDYNRDKIIRWRRIFNFILSGLFLLTMIIEWVFAINVMDMFFVYVAILWLGIPVAISNTVLVKRSKKSFIIIDKTGICFNESTRYNWDWAIISDVTFARGGSEDSDRFIFYFYKGKKVSVNYSPDLYDKDLEEIASCICYHLK